MEAVHFRHASQLRRSIRTELHWKVPNDVKINEGDTFVYDLPGNLEYKSNEKYPIYNGGDVVGYYTIDGDKMVATYTRGESAGSNIEAFVTTDGTITSNKTGGSAGGDTSFTFPGYGTITVNVEGKHSVNVVKRPAISTSDASTYDFVLEVTSTGTNTGVTIDDTMGGLLTFVDGSVHIYTDADCRTNTRAHGNPPKPTTIISTSPSAPWATVRNYTCATR